MRKQRLPPLAFLRPGDPFPAYGSVTEEFGPLAAGGSLDPATLLLAYHRGIFPWYSTPPILWWSPKPRMVLEVEHFRFHKSLRKTIGRLLHAGALEIYIDSDVQAVLAHCAGVERPGQSGTWILPRVQRAYLEFHAAGYMHTVETWINGELAGGLYFVNIGKAVYGESMFALQPDSSKIALAALVAMCRSESVSMIDCQQNTPHLASMGAREISREDFVNYLAYCTSEPAPLWKFSPPLWRNLHPLLPTAEA